MKNGSMSVLDAVGIGIAIGIETGLAIFEVDTDSEPDSDTDTDFLLSSQMQTIHQSEEIPAT